MRPVQVTGLALPLLFSRVLGAGSGDWGIERLYKLMVRMCSFSSFLHSFEIPHKYKTPSLEGVLQIHDLQAYVN